MATLADSTEMMFLYTNNCAKHPYAPLGSVALHAARPRPEHPSWLSVHCRSLVKPQPQTPSEICSV